MYISTNTMPNIILDWVILRSANLIVLSKMPIQNNTKPILPGSINLAPRTINIDENSTSPKQKT
jgi:hypothetical protein